MKYRVLEELPVWQASVELALCVFAFSEKADFRGLGDLKNQLESASFLSQTTSPRVLNAEQLAS